MALGDECVCLDQVPFLRRQQRKTFIMRRLSWGEGLEGDDGGSLSPAVSASVVSVSVTWFGQLQPGNRLPMQPEDGACYLDKPRVKVHVNFPPHIKCHRVPRWDSRYSYNTGSLSYHPHTRMSLKFTTVGPAKPAKNTQPKVFPESRLSLSVFMVTACRPGGLGRCLWKSDG